MIPPMPVEVARTREILQDLEAVQENLLALSDDIWQSIDRQDLDAFDRGVKFMREFIEKMTAFDSVAAEISQLVQQFTHIKLEAGEESGGADQSANERIIAELNREEPHFLSEEFRYKRPHGFILEENGTTGITTWRRLYELVLIQLFDRDSELFRSLCKHEDFISSQDNPTVSTDPGRLRKSMEVRDGIHAESNLSANGIRDVLRRLLRVYGISADKLKIFLREDRDAGRTDGAD